MNQPKVQIQARLGSTRLPGKVFFNLGENRVIEWVVDRCRTADAPEAVVLTIGDCSENGALAEWCERTGVRYHQGPENNLLKRHRKLAHEHNADPVVRITGDCPFVSPAEIDRLIREHAKNDARYTTNVVDKMPIGTAVDVIDRDALDELADRNETHPVMPMRKSPDEWNVVFSPNEQWSEFASAHIAVDTPEDYWRLIDAIDAVGTDPMAVARWIAGEDI